MAVSFEQKKIKLEKKPCHICGGQEYQWGYVQTASFIGRYPRVNYLMASRRCLQCGHVELFVDEEETKRRNRQGCIMGPIILFLIFALTWFVVNYAREISAFMQSLF